MHQLKDIANRMEVHVRTAKRWWRKLHAECVAAGKPGVAPDVIGHGPHRWHDATADRLLTLWSTYYAKRGTTPHITRLKFAGKSSDKFQLDLLSWKNSSQCPPAESAPKSGKKPAQNKKHSGAKRAKRKPTEN